MSEGRYRLLVDAITDYAIYLLDPSGHVNSWSVGAERLKGYSESEILGQHFSNFYPSEDRAAGLPERELATVASVGRFENEGWRIRENGTRFWAHVIIDAIRDPLGKLLGFANITRDQHLVQGVADYAVYMLDPNGNVSSRNLGAQRIKGGQHFSANPTPSVP